MTPGRESLLVLGACAALYLSGIGDIPFYTRGEPREGLVVQEMLRSGEWLVPSRPAGEPARKPPLYYWAAAVALRALPTRPELALRLPSAVLATAAVLLTWATSRAAFGPAAALPTALVLASAFEWTRAATSARVDMALAATLTGVLAGWTLTLVGRRRWIVLAAGGAALGTLAKGPVALVLPGLTAAVVIGAGGGRETARRLRPVSVLGGAAVVAALWFAVALGRQGNALAAIFLNENWHRFLAGDTHVHGPAYLLPLGLVGLLPWTPLLPLALIPLRRATRSRAAVLAAAWVASGLVFFSLAASKRSVYLLPIYPAIALLIGAGAAAGPGEGRLRRAAALAATLYAPAALTLAAVGGALALGLDPGAALRPVLHPPDAVAAADLARAAQAAALPLGLLAAATAGAGLIAARAGRRAAWRTLVAVVAAIAIAWTAFFDTAIHPVIARTRSLRTFLAEVDRLVPADAPLYALLPADPGLRFYAPRPLERWPPGAGVEEARALLWDDQRPRPSSGAARTVRVLAMSEATQPRHGHLALVAVLPGLRTGSRSR